jgi:predicted transposase YdaD
MMKASNFIEEWIQEGWEKGRVKGREEGREEGWRDGQIKVILNQLKKVLGRVRPDLVRKIRLLTDNEIEKLTCDLLDMRAINDLETWLKQRAQSNHKN